MPNPHASALAYLGTVKTPSKPAGAYRPPGARGQVTPLHFKREDEGGAAHISNGVTSLGGANGFGKPRKREVLGAETVGELPGAGPGGGVSLAGTADGDENLSKAALKNKKKREAKKSKEAADRAAGLSTPDHSGDGSATKDNRSPERRDRRGHERSRSKSNLEPRGWSQRREGSRTRKNSNVGRNNSGGSGGSREGGVSIRGSAPNAGLAIRPPPGLSLQEAAPQPLPSSVEAPDLTVTSPGGGSLQEKKIRGLLKKIRAIDDLKMRLAGGEKLEDTQIKKMGTEDGVRKELEALGWNG